MNTEFLKRFNYRMALTAMDRVAYDVFLSLFSMRETNALTAPWLCKFSAFVWFWAKLPIKRHVLPRILSRQTVFKIDTSGPKICSFPI